MDVPEHRASKRQAQDPSGRAGTVTRQGVHNPVTHGPPAIGEGLCQAAEHTAPAGCGTPAASCKGPPSQGYLWEHLLAVLALASAPLAPPTEELREAHLLRNFFGGPLRPVLVLVLGSFRLGALMRCRIRDSQDNLSCMPPLRGAFPAFGAKAEVPFPARGSRASATAIACSFRKATFSARRLSRRAAASASSGTVAGSMGGVPFADPLCPGHTRPVSSKVTQSSTEGPFTCSLNRTDKESSRGRPVQDRHPCHRRPSTPMTRRQPGRPCA